MFLLGHSYGGQVALAAALEWPGRQRKLLLYEAPWPHVIDARALASSFLSEASGGCTT